MGIRVLVVDDSRLIRRVIGKVIRQTGIDVDETLEAGNGQEALDIIARQPVDLVLSNINMPRMDGIQMLTQLRQMQGKQDLPVIMVTTESTESTINQALELGASGYIIKPFTAERLVEGLRKTGISLKMAGYPDDVDLSDPTSF